MLVIVLLILYYNTKINYTHIHKRSFYFHVFPEYVVYFSNKNSTGIETAKPPIWHPNINSQNNYKNHRIWLILRLFSLIVASAEQKLKSLLNGRTPRFSETTWRKGQVKNSKRTKVNLFLNITLLIEVTFLIDMCNGYKLHKNIILTRISTTS